MYTRLARTLLACFGLVFLAASFVSPAVDVLAGSKKIVALTPPPQSARVF